MNELAGWLIEVSWKAAIVVGVVLLAQWLLRRWLSAGQLHALWLLLLARLLLPTLPKSRWSLFGLGAGEPATEVVPLRGLSEGLLLRATTVGDQTSLDGGAPDPLFWLMVAWFLGMVLLAIRAVAAEVRLRKALRAAVPVSDRTTLTLLAEARRLLGLRRRVELLETSLVDSPAVSDLLRARILLPTGLSTELETSQLRHVLLHELAHVRRLDGIQNALAALAATLHWFNPVARYGLRRLRLDREMACDELVLSVLPEEERPVYGRTLLRVLSRARGQAREPALAGLIESHRQIKRRIVMISRFRPHKRSTLLVFAALAVPLAIATLTDVPAAGLTGPGATETRTATAEGPAEPDHEETQTERLERTMTAVREAGSAIFTWYTESNPSWVEASSAARQELGLQRLDWSRCVAISHEDLSALLVPGTVADLPETDGWGHELEYCLDASAAPRLVLTMGVRSPGADGRFTDEPYEVGPFAEAAADRDVVWVDGFFVTWPEAGS